MRSPPAKGWKLRIKTDSKMDKTSIQIDNDLIENHSCGLPI
ncbi:hypothetical protein N8677_02205 [Verrucomicrobia bacterium]|nr:hypothetical protein [Verrucomicrobiota bacterium]MDA7620916.1 hypothetical protein [Verrucomicrobiota bacterium]MDB4705308.1 hypothetical protein [Verrucomicrobiota bacterium]